MQSIQQERFKHALVRVRRMGERGKDARSTYLTGVRQLPADIRNVGLGQALAMLSARATDSEGHRQLLGDIQDWLLLANSASPYHGSTNLFNAITDNNEAKYLQAHAETDAYLAFLKRLAESFLSSSKVD